MINIYTKIETATGIAAWWFGYVSGEPLPSPKLHTLEKISQRLAAKAIDPSSQEAWVLTKKQTELWRLLIQGATTPEEAAHTYNLIPYGNGRKQGYLSFDHPLKTAAWEKWNDLALRAQPTTVSETAVAWHNAPFQSELQGAAKAEHLASWIRLSLVEIEKANTLQDLQAAYERCPDSSPSNPNQAEMQALLKWDQMACEAIAYAALVAAGTGDSQTLAKRWCSPRHCAAEAD